MHLRQQHWWSLRCSWSIACQRCSNCIFILNLTPNFNGLSKDNCKTRRETFKFWDVVQLIWFEVCFLRLGTHFTNTLSAHNSNLAKIFVCSSIKIIIRSGHNFAQVTTAGQNCYLIGWLRLKLEQHKFSQDLKDELINCLWNRSLDVLTRATCLPYWPYLNSLCPSDSTGR